MNKQLQPKLRFPEFNGDYKVQVLRDIAKFSKGKNISKADIDEDGSIECIRYGELYTTYNEVINEVKSKTSIDKKLLIFSEANDIIIPASGESAVDIATASCVIRDGVALGGDLNIIKTPENGVYLSYYFNNKRKYDIAKKSQGISVIHIYADHLKSLNLNLPSLPEQQKIADYLTTIDKKIELLTEKKTELSRYKKAMMQKLFSQEIRFKPSVAEALTVAEVPEAYPEWEEKRLGEICKKSSSSLSANQIEDNRGQFKLYGAIGLMKCVDFYQEEKPYISIVKDGAGVGRVLLCDANSSVLGTLDKISTISSNSLVFIYYYLLQMNFTKFITGSTIPHIYFKDYSKLKLNVPSLPEQQKIADFLSSIDESISKVEEQIKETQNFKKAMLQQMFV